MQCQASCGTCGRARWARRCHPSSLILPRSVRLQPRGARTQRRRHGVRRSSDDRDLLTETPREQAVADDHDRWYGVAVQVTRCSELARASRHYYSTLKGAIVDLRLVCVQWQRARVDGGGRGPIQIIRVSTVFWTGLLRFWTSVFS